MSGWSASCSTALLPASPAWSRAAHPPTKRGAAMTPYLKIDHVDKSFQRGAHETEVLTDITLSIHSGEYVSIIGHSGCGKSTLLNIVAGLLPGTRGAGLLENQEGNEPRPHPAGVFPKQSRLPRAPPSPNAQLAAGTGRSP